MIGGSSHKGYLDIRHLYDLCSPLYYLQFGSFSFNEWQSFTKRVLVNTPMPAKIIFAGANLQNKLEMKKLKRYILIGSVHIEMPG